MAVYKLVSHDLFREVPRRQLPNHNLHIEDPEWYDGIGVDQIEQLGIWDMDSNEHRVEAFSNLLSEHPSRALDMMFSAAAEGNAHVMRFLLGKGVKGTAVEADGDDMSLVPLHAAAYQGHMGCVKILIEEVGVDVNTVDGTGGTPLMRACWGKQTRIVRYLLEKGADIMVRQSEAGPNAFEFASGSGCAECAEMIATHARQLGLRAPELATALALEAAVSSSEIAMLELFFKMGEYPHKYDESGDYNVTISFSDQTMKDAFENGFRRLLQRSRPKSFRKFFAYIDSRGKDGEYNWTSLKEDTLDSLEKAMFKFEGHDDDKDNDALGLVLDIVLSPDSRFARYELLEQKDLILSNCWFWAAQHNNLGTIKLLESSYPNLDINHLTTPVEPKGCAHHTLTSGSGDKQIIKYVPILTAQPYVLDIHHGTNKEINEPTPLWNAVRKGDTERVRLLLESGGPVDRIDNLANPPADEAEKSKVVVTAALAFRTPVKVESQAQWAKEGNVQLEGLADIGGYFDKEGNNVKYVVLVLETMDFEWWDKIQLDES